MYFFRADGNAVTGAGHLMRCLTIAEELRQLPQTGQICFLCADEASAELVKQSGFPAQVLYTDHRNMEEELPVLEGLFGVGHEKEHVILVDSYHVTDAYLEALQSYGRIYLLDDMGKRSYPVDGVINYNAFAQRSHYESLYRGKGTRLAVGSDFVPVRSQFCRVPYTVKEEVKEVLITTGGGDKDNIAAEVLKVIRKPGCLYHVIVGQFSPHYAAWKQMEREAGQIMVHHNVKDMASLMRRCDMAVTAGGTTVYELAAIGVPFLCFSYAENQEALTEYVGREQIAGYCGAYHLDRQGTCGRMGALAGLVYGDVKLRIQMHQREKKMIDGLGTGRIAAFLAGR